MPFEIVRSDIAQMRVDAVVSAASPQPAIGCGCDPGIYRVAGPKLLEARKLIDRTGKTDPDVYKKANVDRKLFSKIRNNRDYRPSKATALAFAIALELDLEATKDFIGRALFEFDQSLLGA